MEGLLRSLRRAPARRRWLVTGGCGQLGAHVVTLLRARPSERSGDAPDHCVHAVCTGTHPGRCVSDEAVDLLAADAVPVLLRRVRPLPGFPSGSTGFC
ncbi:MAG TPA: hypothetical protein VGX23_27605 [Actinocrinis sp.]|nr:hypothetical protein [Actinocrinis sp.]